VATATRRGKEEEKKRRKRGEKERKREKKEKKSRPQGALNPKYCARRAQNRQKLCFSTVF
jgi:hypothetical protein